MKKPTNDMLMTNLKQKRIKKYVNNLITTEINKVTTNQLSSEELNFSNIVLIKNRSLNL